MKPNLFIMILLIAAKSTTTQTLSLHDAYTALINNNPELRIATLDMDKASAAVREAKASWFPLLDAKAGYQWLSKENSIDLDIPFLAGERTIGRQDRTELGLDCVWPVFTGFARSATIQSAQVQMHLCTVQKDGLRQRLAFMLGTLYLQWRLCEKEITLRNALCQQLSVYLEQSTAQFEAGVAVRTRMLDARARLAFAEVDRSAALTRIDSIRIEIESLVDNTFPAAHPDTTSSPFSFADRIGNIAVDTTRPELSQFSIRISQFSLSETVVKSRRYPQISAIAGLRYANPGLAMGSGDFMGYGLIGMNCSWNIFDGFKLSAQKRQLAISSETMSIQKKQRTDDFNKTLSLSLMEMHRITGRLQAAQAATGAAQALAADLDNNLASGTVTHAEYLNAVVAAHQAALVEEQIKTAREIAALRVLYAAGKELVY